MCFGVLKQCARCIGCYLIASHVGLDGVGLASPGCGLSQRVDGGRHGNPNLWAGGRCGDGTEGSIGMVVNTHVTDCNIYIFKISRQSGFFKLPLDLDKNIV